MTGEALVGVVARTEAVRIRVELREERINLAESGHRGAVSYVGALVTGRFELTGSENAFEERGQFVVVNRCAGGRIRADDWRMRDRNSLIFEAATRVSNTTTNTGIFLGDSPVR